MQAPMLFNGRRKLTHSSFSPMPFPLTPRKALSILAILTLAALASGTVASFFAYPRKAQAVGTWTPVVNDSFARANSASIGNGWVDSSGIGSIVSNALVLTVPSAGATVANTRILRPTGEAILDQKVDVTSTLADTNGSLGHGVILRGKSAVIGGVDIKPEITVTLRHNGQLSFALTYNGYTDFTSFGVTGTQSFSPSIGHSYTLSVSALNNFPATVNAIVTDNTASAQVANATIYLSGEYGSTDSSPYWKTAGVAGLTLEGATPGQTVTLSNVTTYSYADSGSFTAAATDALSTGHDGRMYIATPLPTGGTAPYTIRWYRGGNSFTPPTAIDGSGGGTGTFIGTGQEVVDTTAPTGVSNFSLSYRPVFFDSGANATTGILGRTINLNSPNTKPIASPMWVGDSITFGYQTSNGSNSPAKYANTYLAADSSVTAAWQLRFQDGSSYQMESAPGKTSADFAGGNLAGMMSFMAHRRVNVVSIMLGTNDAKDSVATSSAAYKANLQTIIAGLKAVNPSVRVVLNKPLWFKPDTGYAADFSTASLARVAGYNTMIDQLADGASVVIGGNTAYNEIQTYGWTGTTSVANPSNATTSYPPAPTSGRSYLTDGLHPYDGGSEMIGKLEWGPNMKSALLANFTTAYDGTPPAFSSVSSASNNALSTSRGKAGDVVTTTFNTSETLQANPTVTLGGQAMSFVSVSGSTYTYSRTLTGAETAGASAVAITGSDLAGNAGSASATFATDFTAPQVVTSIASTSTATAVTLTWTNPVDADRAFVSVYRSTANGTLGSKVGQTAGGSTATYTDSGLTTGTAYFYTLKASDASGNLSSGTAQTSITPANPVVVVSATPTPTPSPTPSSSPTPTPTASPTITPTATPVVLGVTVDGLASSDTPSIAKRPRFSGTAPAGAVVTVTVHSDPVSCSATAGSDGAWSCALSQDIPAGSHTVQVSAVTTDGTTLSLASFPVTVGTGSGLAKTGTATLPYTVGGFALILLSGSVFALRRRSGNRKRFSQDA